MTKSETQKIKAKEREWDEILRPVKEYWSIVWKEIKSDLKKMMNFMMFSKKPNDRIDRFVHGIEWWFGIGLIFFAIKGFTYWLTGR
jgi:hypothetical protein